MFRLLVFALALALSVATDATEGISSPESGTEAPPPATVSKNPVPVQRAPGLGEPCGARNGPAVARCAPGLECVKSKKDKKGGSRTGVCTCKNNYEVCGTDGVSYDTACALKAASARAEGEGKSGIKVQHKGKCLRAPTIVTRPGEVWNVTGSQVFLSCEAIGIPTPVVTWKKINNNKGKMLLLPGDQENLAIQTRGGPEKYEVTGWVLISPLTKWDAGSYECHASNTKGEASAVGTIHVVESISDIPTKKVVQDDEL
ncbi:insulin-like growth factor-binding protein 7 [Salminus brasiliensis]|uniref:insulin-like growth factor-binding protein 7 n=1 Tax=Salminus brasiliensis TaxID=930266 RepID=UPI003B83875E